MSRVVILKDDQGFYQVTVDGIPISNVLGVNVALRPTARPTVTIELDPQELIINLDDAQVVHKEPADGEERSDQPRVYSTQDISPEQRLHQEWLHDARRLVGALDEGGG